MKLGIRIKDLKTNLLRLISIFLKEKTINSETLFQVFYDNGEELGVGVVSCHCLPGSTGVVKVPILSKDHSVVAVLRRGFFSVSLVPASTLKIHCFRFSSVPPYQTFLASSFNGAMLHAALEKRSDAPRRTSREWKLVYI